MRDLERFNVTDDTLSVKDIKEAIKTLRENSTDMVDIYATEIEKDNYLNMFTRSNGNKIIYTKRPIKGVEYGKQN